MERMYLQLKNKIDTIRTNTEVSSSESESKPITIYERSEQSSPDVLVEGKGDNPKFFTSTFEDFKNYYEDKMTADDNSKSSLIRFSNATLI